MTLSYFIIQICGIALKPGKASQFSNPCRSFQDFDYWDDVGLNIPQPPNLLRLYRDFDKHAMPLAATALAKTEEENAKLVNAHGY